MHKLIDPYSCVETWKPKSRYVCHCFYKGSAWGPATFFFFLPVFVALCGVVDGAISVQMLFLGEGLRMGTLFFIFSFFLFDCSCISTVESLMLLLLSKSPDHTSAVVCTKAPHGGYIV